MESRIEPIELRTVDGTDVAATVYAASGRERGLVLVAGATATPQGFYRRFAESLAAGGNTVLTLDYRGIGRSRRGPLRGFEADYLSWARDIDAALEWALARGPTVVVGHSFGGHGFGLLARANETRGLLAFGTGAGWHGWMPVSEQARVQLLWKAIGPVSVSALGYLPMRRLGMGEDLPAGVYRQWKRWCGFPRYFFDDPAFEHRPRFAAVRVPIRAVNATDDRWAPPASARAFFGGYTGAPVAYETVEPRARRLAEVGHFGYFRPSCAALWRDAAAFVAARLSDDVVSLPTAPEGLVGRGSVVGHASSGR